MLLLRIAKNRLSLRELRVFSEQLLRCFQSPRKSHKLRNNIKTPAIWPAFLYLSPSEPAPDKTDNQKCNQKEKLGTLPVLIYIFLFRPFCPSRVLRLFNKNPLVKYGKCPSISREPDNPNGSLSLFRDLVNMERL